MMDMREKIAREIYESRNGAGCKPWERVPGYRRKHYLIDACAALRALEEPTPEMDRAGGSSRCHPSVYMGGPPEQARRDAVRIFTAMIRAAKGGSDA